MNIGIVGNGKDKFTIHGMNEAKKKIVDIMLTDPDAVFASGHSPMGGVDIWVEEMAKRVGVRTQIFVPQVMSWEGGYGYRARNLDIARFSDKVYVIVADSYPPEYSGRRFHHCYHCIKLPYAFNQHPKSWHVKSGGCWTAVQAIKMAKEAEWVVIRNE